MELHQARNYSTATAAAALGIRPASLSTSLWRHGHYCGVRPAKMPNGRLLWPGPEIDALVAGTRSDEAPDTGARLAAARGQHPNPAPQAVLRSAPVLPTNDPAS